MEQRALEEDVPVKQDLRELYDEKAIPGQERRWAQLRAKFLALYGFEPDFFARSPGRVNIIGEHIDYSLFQVLPMGIASDVVVAVGLKERKEPKEREEPTRISLANLDPRFSSVEVLIADQCAHIDPSTHEWSNYFKAGLNGALELLSHQPGFAPKSLACLVHGTVPAGGGLSSSAALVCASALAVLFAHHHGPWSKKDLVELALVSERSVGVNSGGMDQAASVASKHGGALAVSFWPALQAEVISFPPTLPIKFMIAQSFVSSEKHVTGPVCYNLRVVECTLAAQYLASLLGLTLQPDASPLSFSLCGLHDAYSKSLGPTKSATLDQMVDLVQTHLHEEGYIRHQIAGALNMTTARLELQYMTKFPIRAERFLLRQRALHVFTEAIRVRTFIGLLRETTLEPDGLLVALGSLMNETQQSCRSNYDCSCPELDELCAIALKAGAYGSRLTGAGWGGCSVHLVPEDKVEAVREAWIREYYSVRYPEKQALEEAIVISEPGHGSMILQSPRSSYRT